MIPVAILLLAAGASSRMKGRDKLLEEIDGTPLQARQCARAVATGFPVYVTLPARDHPRAAYATGTSIVEVPEAAEGMGASLRTGVSAIPEDHAILVLPADMPDISDVDISQVISAFQFDPEVSLQQATSANGTPGHPVLFPPDCRAGLLASQGDTGARHVLKANAHRVKHVALPGNAALTDLDTPEAWADYLAKRTPGG